MPSPNRQRGVWLGLCLGLLGLIVIGSMWTSGAAALPHVLAALTVWIPLTLFGVVLKSPWPAVGALALLLVIDVTLRLG
ncbi:hypothetical protein [Halomonas sp. BL6]|uniref:hypothetical protein n=1 Tax=Halomonas sp. BL6 TaxID=2585770 RepID=UPI0011187B41|nr:hypothetical protein [Halomonas sp. BL6]TNH18685.1 hypothetical protein FHJ80_04825 [Halomonas sp. BL6]